MVSKALTAKLLLLLILSTLLTAPDWQASGFAQGGWPGDMRDNRQPNLPQVYVEIDKVKDVPGASTLMMARNTSNALNELWDPAWNVLFAQLSTLTVDFVVFGYAFRFHWMWHNNYMGFSIVIFKDYNCEEWREFDSLTFTDGNSGDTWVDNYINYINPRAQPWGEGESEAPPNVWRAAQAFTQWAEESSSLMKTYSGVFFRGKGGDVTAWSIRYCGAAMGDWGFFNSGITLSFVTYTYQYFLFETRSGNWRS